MGSYVYDVIDHSRKARVTQVKKLLNSVPVRVKDPCRLVCVDLIDFSFDILQERKVLDWRISRDLPLGF